jgi:hypothetical protein
MKKTVAVITTACALAGQPAKASDALWNAFQNPPNEARASCYWWWKGDLTAPEMGRQLRLFKEAGLGGAHIIPWGGGKPAYLTPEWLELLGTAADAAKQEGLILDMSANAAWPFRGKWVSEEDSLHKVDVKTYQVEGPQKFSIPAKNAGDKKEKDEGTTRILMAQLAPDPVSRMDQMQDVTDGLTKTDSPEVDVPAGRHTIYVVRQLSGVKTQPDFGRVPDHFNPAAMERYLKGFAERVAPALGGNLSNGLRALYCDSIELSEANWTPNFPEEFKRRCGYDLMPYLPLLLSMDANRKKPGGRNPLDETIVRVRYDYCRTLSDLFLEGFARPFYRWCHENGVLCRMQLYGWPWFYNIDDGYRIPDMPEGNNWLFSGGVFSGDQDIQGWPIWQKYTSSGAHQAGRRIASTEAMTVVEGKYMETLDLVKRADDFNFVCGINHSFLHGFCYSPANEPFPGRNQYGTYFSEQNTWWPYMRQWMDYNARLNAVFQSSQPVAQVALLFRTSDVWGQAGLDRGPFQTDPPWAHQVWRWINQNGANADYVSDQILQQAAFDNGKIAFGPMHYDALIVLGAKTLVPATAEALERYAKAGGKIVFAGDLPESSPGLQDAPANDAKVRTIIQNLLRNYPASVIRRSPPAATAPSLTEWRKNASTGQCLAWTDQLLTDLKIQRSVQFEKQPEGLYQIHYRSDDGRDLYFFANTAQSNVAARAAFASAGKYLERWNPETGTRSGFPVDKTGRALIALPPAGSLLLAAGAGEALVSADLPVPPERTVVQEITGTWSVSFKPADGGEVFQMEPFKLAGLHESGDARLNRFAGQAVYKTDFTWNKFAGKALHLDLGAVPNCITEVTLNGQPLGTRWYGRHDYLAGDALKQGENRLEVKVVTTLFNRLRKDTEKAVPSGLIGPVVLSAE